MAKICAELIYTKLLKLKKIVQQLFAHSVIWKNPQRNPQQLGIFTVVQLSTSAKRPRNLIFTVSEGFQIHLKPKIKVNYRNVDHKTGKKSPF